MVNEDALEGLATGRLLVPSPGGLILPELVQREGGIVQRLLGRHMQAMALGPCEVHIAAQGMVEVLQGFLCHLHLPLGHEDVRIGPLGKLLFMKGFQPGALHSSWSMSSWRRLIWSRHCISASELRPVSEKPGDQVGDRPTLRKALRPARRLPRGLLCTSALSSSDHGPRAWASRVSDAPSSELCRAWSWLTVSRSRKRVTNWSTLEARSYSSLVVSMAASTAQFSDSSAASTGR